MKQHFVYLFYIILFELAQNLIVVETLDYGVLASETSTDKENFCIIYFKVFSSLPKNKSDAKFYILQDESDVNWCDDQPQIDVRNKVLLITNNNCSISTQARNVYNGEAGGLLFITPYGDENLIKVNASTAEGINMSVALISKNSAARLMMMYPGVSVCLFAPTKQNFDFSLIAIFVLALFTVTVGSYWSGLTCYALYCKEVDTAQGALEEPPIKPHVSVNPAEDSSLNVSPTAVVCLVICMGLMLVLLYFFFNYLIYLIIGLFVIASIISLYSCLEPLIMKIKLNFCRVRFGYGSRICTLDFRQIILFFIAAGLSIYWLIIRKESYSWILQCILGVAFCIHMLKSIRLPSFKICTYLLVLLFFYDIFFVFITPFLTGKKESVMEEVATGGNSKEMIPMVFKIPHFGFDTLSVCYQQFSLLGFGDVLVPGLLVSYCHGFDLMTSKKRIYFFTTVITYGVGLIITAVSLIFMNTAQPALLYLVPCTLLPAAIVACFKKEFSLLWNGFKVLKTSISAQEETATSPGYDNHTHHENNDLLR